jgi:hypothetical protein
MKNPQKRIKLSAEVEDSSLDPFKYLHEDVHKLIYHHLDYEDVLTLFSVSPVSPKWNRQTSESPAAMKKIKFVFSDKSSTSASPRRVTAMLKSQRNYQNFKGTFRYSSNIDRKLLLLKRFSHSLVNLEVVALLIDLSHHFPANLNFPKLKSLDVESSNRVKDEKNIAFELFKNAPNIKKLTTFKVWNKNADKMLKCLMEKSELQELKFFNTTRKDVFHDFSMQHSKLKLKSLSFESRSVGSMSPQARLNFDNFLLQMAETLTHVEIECCFLKDILLISKFPVLISFECDRIADFNVNIDQLKPNTTIKKFKLMSPNVINLIGHFIALEDLTISCTTTANFDWIIGNVHRLKKLKILYGNCSKGNHVWSKKIVEKRYNNAKAADSAVIRGIDIQ